MIGGDVPCVKCGHPRRVHCDPPVLDDREEVRLHCAQPYPLTPGSSCGCDGYAEPAHLSNPKPIAGCSCVVCSALRRAAP